jgi:hypothetical protein
LRVVQRELQGVRTSIARLYLRHGIGVSGAENRQQFLRLALELIYVRVLAKGAGT